ncbi:hypothetical protein [Pedococcus sp. 5OH_020]|uniref:hypothetical protein n=1 Tax=Pedococcus sp. 5OH_020 TaxID=2989814 RepID=UPI0022E9BB2F|nr:hypothetical protein [Pedococcus sp. 5OH_020]
MDESTRASTRAALALVTAWLEDPMGEAEFPTGTMIELIGEIGRGDDIEGLVSLVIGAVTLSGHLLERLREATGVPVQQTLRDVALAYT